MANRRRSIDERKIAQWCKEGRGKGRGVEYLPWLTTQDVPSKGRSHRVRGRKTGRIHHLLSDNEWRLFLFLDWCDDVTDIREQFPLDRITTRRIAESLGVRHPIDLATKTPLVMTTDLLVDVFRNGKISREACCVKPASQLENRRTLQKLEIERCYWAEEGVPFHIFSEREFLPVLTKNLEWLRGRVAGKWTEPWAGFHQEKADAVLTAVSELRHLDLRQFCEHMDRKLSLKRGSSLALMRFLLSTKAVSVDLSVALNDHRPMNDFTTYTAGADSEVA